MSNGHKVTKPCLVYYLEGDYFGKFSDSLLRCKHGSLKIKIIKEGNLKVLTLKVKYDKNNAVLLTNCKSKPKIITSNNYIENEI